MIVVLKPDITKRDEQAVLREIRKLGYKPHVMRGVERTVIGAIGDERTHSTLETLVAWPQVEKVMPVQKRYKLVSREAHKANSQIRLGNNVVIGQGATLAVIGVVLGLLGATWGTKLLQKMLHGVDHTDPASFVAGGALLLATALLACVVPMNRAVQVDPQIAMRAE